MKKLKNKVFFSLFIIISLFSITSIVIYNIQTYRIEYKNIYRSLNIVENINRNRPAPNRNNITSPNDIDNMMIMDYEVYTVRLKSGKVSKITVHGEASNDFDIESIVNNIINNDNKMQIGSLYLNKYAYNYRTTNTIVIVNLSSVNNRLLVTLIGSILLMVVFEVIIYFIALQMNKWITKPAEESFNKQKDFIADASHELKTPLAVIIGSADELKSDKKNAKYVENIKFEAERMSKLISRLLDLSKLENGVNIENYKEENISKIIEKIVLTFEGIAFENDLLIETNIDNDIIFKCSKEEIEKLISILLDNAIKHSYKDSTILVNVSSNKNEINIDITNSGDPINKGDEERIFERFYRADKSRKRDANRYGLGLAIAKNIVENHNGMIKAFSENNKTTFKINLKKKEH